MESDIKIKVFIVLGLINLLVGCYRAGQEELQRSVDPMNEGNYSGAIAQLMTLKEKYPRDARIYYYLGYAYLKECDYSLAFQHISTALKIRPNYKQVIGDVNLANFLMGNSQDTQGLLFKVSVRELQKIIREHRGSKTADEVQYHLGFIFLMKKQYQKALAALQKVIEQPPVSKFDIQALLAQGYIYLSSLDAPEKGIGIYQAIIDQYSGSEGAAEALYKLALYHKRRGDMYEQRHLALEKFYRQWKGIEEFAEDRRKAKLQAREDLEKAQVLHKTATTEIKELIDHYPQSFYHSRAKALLAELQKNQ